MSMPIRLPDGSVKTVELEYEKLEKHCFNCFELSHEKKDCHRPLVSRSLGINQLKAAQRLESERRRHEERRDDRHLNRPLVDRNRGNREHLSNRELGLSSRFTASRDYKPLSRPRDYRDTPSQRYPSRSRGDGNERHRSRTPPSRHYSAAGDLFHADQSRASQKGINGSVADEGGHLSARGRDTSNSESHRNPPRQISHHRSPSRRSFYEVASRSGKSRYSGTPPPCRPRQAQVVPTVGETGEAPSVQQSRRPALERISPRIQLNAPLPTSSRTNSERLQDVEIQYAENNHHDMLGVIQNNSMTAEEQRIPTSLRLGPIPPVPQPKAKAKGAPRKKATTATTSNATGRRKSTKASPKRRVARNSPLQGISLRKRNVSRPNTKKKLCVDSQDHDDSLPATQDPMDIGQASAPPINLIPATSKASGDFRSPSNLLP